MRLSKEFKKWFEKTFELNFPKETNMNYYCFNFKAMYDAFNAHKEELDRLRKFEKKFRTLQHKLQELDEQSYKDVKAMMKFDNTVEELLYL